MHRFLQLQVRPVDKKNMILKRLIRTIFILVPIALLAFQLFWPSPVPKQPKLHIALKAMLPPLGFIFHYIDFNQKNALAKWEEKIFQGKSAYWIEFKDSSGYLHSLSKSTASAIFYRIKYNINDYPYVSWKWKIEQFPPKKNITDPKKKDDFAARFYLVFLSKFFTGFRCVEYVWDETLPEETVLISPYSDQIKQIVIQSGKSPANKWISETRNVAQDYEKLFGEKPKMKVSAIALMTDSEGSNAQAEAFFDDIQIGKSATERNGSASNFGGKGKP